MAGHTLWKEYRKDVERTYDGPPTLLRLWLGPLAHAGLRAGLFYRLSNAAWRRRPLRILASLLKRCARLTTGAEIHPAAAIGGGLHLPHPQGVVIGASVKIVGPATIFQQVTLGPRNENGAEGNAPELGPYTFVYPGARVLGPLKIGARSQIGPNCVIYRSLPDGSTVLPPEPLVLEGLSFSLRFQLPEAKSAPAQPPTLDELAEPAGTSA